VTTDTQTRNVRKNSAGAAVVTWELTLVSCLSKGVVGANKVPVYYD